MAHATPVAEPVPVPARLIHSPNFSGRIAELDGVRALAILMVMAAHVLWAFPNPDGAFDRVPKILQLLVGHGWLGVDLFFVLSGFLITGILMDTKHKPQYARNFYGRRVLRIFPLYLVTVFVLWLFYSNATKYLLISLVFLANFDQPFHIHEPHGMGMLWSLNVEEHFYFLWPWLVLLLSRKHLTYLAGFIALGTPVLRWFYAAQGTSTYYYSWFRFDGLAIGALIAIFVRSKYFNRRSSLWLAVGSLGAFVVITLAGLPFGIMREGVAGSALRYTQADTLFGALMFFVLALLNTPFTAIFRTRFLVLTGELSYCLYLVHVAIGDGYVWLTDRFGIVPEHRVGALGAVLLRSVAILVCSYVIALISRSALERPFLRMKKYF